MSAAISSHNGWFLNALKNLWNMIFYSVDRLNPLGRRRYIRISELFFNRRKCKLEQCYIICLHEVPVMICLIRGFAIRAKKENFGIITIHSLLDRENLQASRRLLVETTGVVAYPLHVLRTRSTLSKN